MENKSEHPNASMEKIARTLQNRPSKGQFREQLFWLVDLVYTCKASDNLVLREEAKLMESALKRLGDYLETGDEEGLAEAALRTEKFARVVQSAVMGEKLDFNVFLSYSTADSNLFNIPKIAQLLENYPQISKVCYWEKDSGQNIIDYMEENLENSKCFVLFCTQNSKDSKSVKLERNAALQLQQQDKIRIVPVFHDPADIPLLIKPFLGLEFHGENLEDFVPKLYKEIFRS